MSSQTTLNQSSRPNTASSPSINGVPIASFATLQSTYSSTPTVNSLTTQKFPSSIIKPLERFLGSPNSSKAQLNPGAETKAEKRARKQREQEAKMTPEELRLANLMKSYGAGPPSPSNPGRKY
ncbi:hypothetical protein FRB96_003660 [Tulasnella sp. 330]|nr:hypothetical protein FRB96_003660 [Tulasnella sp. 330]KAG8878556.1 hypothetical protein FRB97_002391 [Tulasnella sp. 331]KAG8885726.1 hypothetical protein FRB98_001679 [Tulasnella sp. 332]